MKDSPESLQDHRYDFLGSDGEMAQRIREFDWERTPLGPVETWSPALRMMLRIMLVNRFPYLLWWGPDYVQLYNDHYIPIPGAKHPHQSFGVPGRECWPEIWDIIGPLVDRPFNGGEASWADDIALHIHRHGFMEETHFTIAYSPVPDDAVPSGIGGVVATVHEITDKVIGQRRIAALRDLGARASEAKTAQEACGIAVDALVSHQKDIPFAMLYLIDNDRAVARLACAGGIEHGRAISPATVDLTREEDSGWPLGRALASHQLVVVDRLHDRFDFVPPGPWEDSPDTAVVATISGAKAGSVAGFLVAGLSSRLRFDAGYRDFIELIRSQLSATIANARAYEEERQRAEALAALDHAKTQFFSNVSHEFRTPLTLMLGPVEELLNPETRLVSPEARAQLEVVHRNSLRMLRLVNALLEFTRIEAGRANASFEPVDLPALTADLASNFRSACERAGIRLVIDCQPLGAREPAYVDRDMWEKIVLNLVSNAFKFTLAGEIEVRVEPSGDRGVRLVVRDTGSGIPGDELPHMFDRFHRIQNAQARTHEGTGIGLALVSELVKLHGGEIGVDSVAGEGSRFTVTLPLGSDHLPPADIRTGTTPSDRVQGAAFVEEALRWISTQSVGGYAEASPAQPAVAGQEKLRILWADDNADMREYVTGLLRDRYEVEAVGDGARALEAARQRKPDLVLTDAMMPRLDGFGLVKALRSTDGLRDVPVIMISARAGEESRIGGLEAGVDDYVIKPFSARELVARVDAQMRLLTLRRKAEAEVRRSMEQSQDVLREADRRKDEFLATLAHELRNPLAPVRNAVAILALKGRDIPELQWARAVIDRQMEQMTRLVDDLLDVSRISRGKVELKRDRVDLSKALFGAVEASRPYIEQGGHDLRVSLPGEPIHIHADETRLIQIFGNLLNNAAKYSDGPSLITLTAYRDKSDVVVSVRDTGVGIHADNIGRVFEMFTQVDLTREGSKGGLGVGLTLVKRLVELHGGQVEARSEGLGKGSEFIVRLPILVGASTSPQPRGETPTKTESKCRILIVDDNRDAADSLALTLQLVGHEVSAIYDGREAVKAAYDFMPDVVLLDIGLPGLDGYATARALRAEPGGEDLTLIAVTGWGQESDRRRSQEAGFDHHLVKPVAPGFIMELLTNVMAARKQGVLMPGNGKTPGGVRFSGTEPHSTLPA